jgi:DNA-binding GntR family transcriptional regulator
MKGRKNMAAVHSTDFVYKNLKERITEGDFSPSEQLTEMDLAQHYEVSRNTVKKALLMLERENLITIEPNKGAKVRSYSISEVLDFLEIRAVLEGLIAKLTAPIIQTEQLRQLEETLQLMRQKKEERDLLAYSQGNKKFHQIIYDACPNHKLTEMTVSLKNQLSKYNIKTILVPGRDADSFAEHSAILKAFQEKDAPQSELLMRQHIMNVRETFSKYHQLLF